MQSFDYIIIGGGHNGMVAAGYLAKAGLHVIVLEKWKFLGGCSATAEVIPTCPGFKFNLGGVDHIHILGTPVVRELELEKFGFKYLYHDPLWFFPYPDGNCFPIYRSIERSCEEIARFAPEDAEAYRDFNNLWQEILHILEPFDLGPPPSLADLARVAEGCLKGEELLQFLLTPPKTFIERWFKSPYLRGLFAWWAIQVGSSPRQPGAVLATGLQTTSHLVGMARPEGGSGALTDALRRLVEHHGGVVRTEAEVTRILLNKNRVTGVRLQDGEEIACSKGVVSQIDAVRVFTRLLDESDVPGDLLAKVRNIEIGDVALFKVDVALDGLPVFERYGGKPEFTLATQCIAPSMDYVEEAFDDILHGRPSTHPALWCAVPSHLDPTLAPEGKHTLWLSQFAPARLADGRSWDEARDEVADNMIATYCQYAPNTHDLIIDRHISSPLDWERRTGNLNGNAFHIAMTVNQLMGFRPIPALSRFRTPIQGLYLSGSGVHPGGGITGLPGRNTAMTVLSDLGHRPRRKCLLEQVKQLIGMYRALRRLDL